MSLIWMVKALSCKVKNASRKLVLIKLADNANDNGICWPSIKHIADQCEMSTRTVQRHLKDLSDAGFIHVEERRRNNFVNQSNLYTLVFHEGKEFLQAADDLPVIAVQPNQGEGDNLTPLFYEGDNLSPPPDTVSPSPPVTVSPRTCHSFEPVIEPSSTYARVSENSSTDVEGDMRKKFRMHESWQVGEQFQQLCRIRGLDLGKCDGAGLVDEVRDFVSYWSVRPETELTQGLWENKLAQHLQRMLRQGKLSSEVNYAKRSSHFEKPRSVAELHAESCAGAFDERFSPYDASADYGAGDGSFVTAG